MILRCQIVGSKSHIFPFPPIIPTSIKKISIFFFFFHCRLHPMMIPDLAVLSEDERSEALETSMERAQRKSADD